MDLSMIIAIVVLVFVVILIALLVAWQIKKNGLKQFVVNMIVKAEDMYKQGDNEAKMDYVIDRVIAVLPAVLQLFITRNAVKAFIQTIFDMTKQALDYTPKN